MTGIHLGRKGSFLANFICRISRAAMPLLNRHHYCGFYLNNLSKKIQVSFKSYEKHEYGE
jgi:hypothetical protein